MKVKSISYCMGNNHKIIFKHLTEFSFGPYLHMQSLDFLSLLGVFFSSKGKFNEYETRYSRSNSKP